MQDLLAIYEADKHWPAFEELINKLKDKYRNKDEALGNVFIHYAMYLSYSEQDEISIEHFKLARELFKKIDVNHYVLRRIDEALSKKT
ncbi:MAG: hypothetical protein ACI9OI_001445 [Chitinophagales bacterium]|jgi:hypothetical protein